MRHPLFSDPVLLKSHAEFPSLPNISLAHEPEDNVAFITGATGFIGGFLVKQLLEAGTFQQIICLVRGVDHQQAAGRLRDSLLQKGVSEVLLDTANMVVITGDVLLPFFGLKQTEYDGLAGEVDHFFHFAATMNWVAPFNQDTVANIDALKSAVAFCQHTRLTKLHYASSMGIWTLLSHAPGPILEDNIHDQGGELPGGYFQSKWVNELILHKAMRAGLPVNIYRIGDVKGNSESGLGDPHNFGNLVMQYFIKNSIVIDNSTPEFNFIPVDYLTRAIAHIATRETGKTFQFTNPDLISFRDIYTAAENVGHKCRLVTHSEWLDELSADSDQLARVLKPIFREFQPGFNHSPKSFYQIGVEMFKKPHDTTNTCTALQHTSLRCPGMLQDQVLERYLVHLGETAQL